MTPVYTSESIQRESGRACVLKAENLQRTGSFKIRGAFNKLATLSPEERAAGVIAASAGNHGQAVAWAARELGIHATIYMPAYAPMAKVDPTLTYGGEAVLTGEGFDDALSEALQRVEQTGATFIHAFEDEHVIAGQGTIGLELAEQVPDVETVLIPIGGGGLASGVAIALRALRPNIRLVGVEVRRDLHTIADGIAVKYPGELTMEILGRLLDEVVVVNDDEISDAITLLLERSKLLVEGAGAVGVAAVLAGKVGGTGLGLPRGLRRQHRPDDADVGAASRHDRRGALPRDAHPAPRPPRRADPGLRARCGRERQHRPDRASPRGRAARSRRRRPRPHRRDAQRGALPPPDHGARGERLPGGAAQLMAAREFFAELPEKAEPARLAGVDSSYLFDIAGEGRWLVEVRDQKVTVTENPEGTVMSRSRSPARPSTACSRGSRTR